jgi:hypothetical protein
MKFEWHTKKNIINREKHGINFEYAAYVFLDETRVEYADNRKDYGEIRSVTIGKIEERLYTVVYTIRAGNYRLISARKANRDERETYNFHYKTKNT